MHHLLTRPADQVPVVVIDLETTGLEPGPEHRIVELAVIRRDHHGQETLVDALVDPGQPIPASAIAIHGITDAMVQGQPTFAKLWPQAAPLLRGAVLIGHNIAFDLAFLRAACTREGLPRPKPAVVVDTLQLARTVFGLIRCNLQALANRIGVDHEHAHRAMPDARATLQVYDAMVAALKGDQQAPTVGELQELTRSLAQGGKARRAIRKALSQAWSDGHNVVIDYTSGAGGALTTRREITITRLRPPYVEAQCHLREAPRVFKLNRIRRVAPADDDDALDTLPTPE